MEATKKMKALPRIVPIKLPLLASPDLTEYSSSVAHFTELRYLFIGCRASFGILFILPYHLRDELS